MTRWDEVRAWRDRLRRADIVDACDDLSPEGLREAVDSALEALSDEALHDVASLRGQPFARAVVITTGTVPTAALEWVALLLGRGSQVTWKHPAGRPGLAPLAAQLAGGLPLRITSDRDCLDGADVIVVLGSDETVRQVRAAAPKGAQVYGHGHAWSCAWVTGQPLPPDRRVPSGFTSSWGRVAADATLFDGRGCLSPVVVFTSIPLERALDSLATAMQAAAERWPLGIVHPSEAALERQRRAHTRVVGTRRRGEGWALHGVSARYVSPVALPRSVAVVSVPSLDQAVECASQWGQALSTVGTDDPTSAAAWFEIGATRICALGRMQRPPLDRVHDGVRWIYQTFRATALEL